MVEEGDAYSQSYELNLTIGNADGYHSHGSNWLMDRNPDTRSGIKGKRKSVFRIGSLWIDLDIGRGQNKRENRQTESLLPFVPWILARIVTLWWLWEFRESVRVTASVVA